MLSKIIPAIFFFTLITFAAHAQVDSTKNEADDTEDKTFDKVEIEASFPGGDEAWRTYLEDNLNANIPVENGAPIGIYTVMVQFIVDKEGNISDVKALTSLGYGMEQEVIRVIRKGPRWSPAYQSGRIVKAYRKQPVTFQVEDDDIIVITERPFILFKAIDNLVSIKVYKEKDKDLEITVSKGTIIRQSEGLYLIRVNRTGRILLTIRTAKKGKELGVVSFAVID